MRKFQFLVIFILLLKFIFFILEKVFEFDVIFLLFKEILLLTIFSIGAIYIWHQINSKLFYIQLPIIVTIFFPFLQVILPVLIIFLFNSKADIDTYYEFIIKEVNYLPYLNKTISITTISMIVFWFGVFITNYFLKNKNTKLFTFNNYKVSLKLILILYLFGIVSRMIQIDLGIFGYSFDTEKLEKYFNVFQFLITIERLCSLSFFLICFLYRKSHFLLYILIIIIELIFGLISGMKSNVIFIGVTIFLIEYLQTNKLKLKYFVFSIGLTIFAYTIIEPMRFLRQAGNNDSYINTLSEAITTGEEISNTDNKPFLLITLMERFDIVSYSARAINYKDKTGLNKKDPEFFKQLTFAPFYAIIPRIFWPDKPVFDYGVWFTRNVIWEDFPLYAEDFRSSTAMGPIGYLYICGGYIYIILYMALLGVLALFLTSNLIINQNNLFGILIYLSFILFFVNVDHFGLINHIFKTLPLLLILLKIISKYATR